VSVVSFLLIFTLVFFSTRLLLTLDSPLPSFDIFFSLLLAHLLLLLKQYFIGVHAQMSEVVLKSIVGIVLIVHH